MGRFKTKMALGPKKIPAVAVIIPTSNRAQLVAAAVKSVLCQDFGNFELLVIDDGSTDDTLDRLAVFGDRLRIICQQNRGVSAARNRGIQCSTAPLIAFLDSDDLWLPGKLARQVAFLEENPDCQICQTEEIWVRNGRRVNPKRRHRKTAGRIFERSLELCLISPSAVMLRRPLLETVGMFDERLPACEDYDLWLRVSCRYPVGLIDLPLIVKRGGHADQLSRMPGLDRYRIHAIVNLLEADVLESAQYQAAVKVLQKKCAIYAQGCRKRGRIAECEAYTCLSERYAASGC